MEDGRGKNPNSRNGFKSGEKHFLFGKHHSEETKRKMREVQRPKKGLYKMCNCGNMFYVKPCRIAIAKHCSTRCINKGKKFSEETRHNMSIARKGVPTKSHPAWNKGLKGYLAGNKNVRWIADRTKLARQEERDGQAHKDWSRAVKIRDSWKCRIDNEMCNGKVVAHHILSFSKFPELRYNINNGITLCHAHHPRKRAEEVLLAPYFSGLVTTIAN